MEENSYQRLGKKTLMIFVLDRISASLLFLLAAIVLFILAGQPIASQIHIPNFNYYINLAAWICLGLFAVIFLIGFFIAWLSYITYTFALGEDSLRIKRGILNKEEVAIPYRQIQDVDINRDLGFQIMGLSRIVILTAGHEDEPKGSESCESEGILPALDKDLAEELQTQLLRRANVQKVVETPPASAPPGANPPVK